MDKCFRKLPEVSEFSAKKQLVAMMLVQGMSHLKAAESAGISPRTIYNWARDPEFRKYINGLRDAFIDETLGCLTSAARGCAEKLKQLQNNPNPAIQLRATELLMQFLLRFRDHREFADRIAALENADDDSIDIAGDGDDDVFSFPKAKTS